MRSKISKIRRHLKAFLIWLNKPFSILFYFVNKRYQRFRIWLRSSLPYFVVLVLVTMLVLIFFWTRIVITIHSGQGGVLYERFFGTEIDKVYPEGLHIIFPWDRLYIYDVRIQTVLHDFYVLTKQGLPVHLSLAIRFRPEYEMLGVLHQQVGPDYINTIIIPQVESVLRKRLSNHTPEDIYVNKNNVLTKVVTETLEELGRKYVKANDVIIRNVELPTTIKTAIEAKLIEEQNDQRYEYVLRKEKKEAERKRIEAQGIKDYQQIVSRTLTPELITWQGVKATLQLAESNNSKVVIIGSGKTGMPIILGADYTRVSTTLNKEDKKQTQDKKQSQADAQEETEKNNSLKALEEEEKQKLLELQKEDEEKLSALEKKENN